MTALKCAAATVAILNIIGATQLAAYFFRDKGLFYRLLIASLAINPYLFYCLFWRGAFAECLAIALMPFFVLATLKIANQCSLKHGIGLAIITWLIAIAHVPTLIIVFFLFNGYSLLIAVGNHNKKDFLWRTAFFTLGLALAAPYLGPVALNLSQIRQPTWYPLQDYFAFGKNFPGSRHNTICSVMFGIYFITYLLAVRPALKRQRLAKPGDIGLLIVLSGVALLMSQPLAAPIYKLVPLIKKVQFPTRFLAISSTLVPTLAVLSASLRFKQPKQIISATLPVFIALCLPLWLLFQSVTTPTYLSTTNKEIYSTLITSRLEHIASDLAFRQPNDPIKKVIKIHKNDIVLSDDSLVVPDVVDYLPKSLKPKSSFWQKDKNVVRPVVYQNHYLKGNTAQLQLTAAKSSVRRWRAKVTNATTVELGITDFANWQVSSIPAGMVSARHTSDRGLISVDLSPGSYELIAEYKAGWSNGFLLIPLAGLGLLTAARSWI